LLFEAKRRGAVFTVVLPPFNGPTADCPATWGGEPGLWLGELALARGSPAGQVPQMAETHLAVYCVISSVTW